MKEHMEDQVENNPDIPTKDGSGWQDLKAAPSYNHSKKIDLDEKSLMSNHCFCYFSDLAEADYYKVLRTQIQSEIRKNNWNTVMVTSALPREGKTTTSVNLALSFAKDYNQTVLLVDADLKKQHIHKYMGFDGCCGLVDCLVDDVPLSDTVVWPGVEKLTVISGDQTFADSAELVGSPKMKSLAQEMKNRYQDRLIIFDFPAIQNCADVLAFAPMVDCFLMVVDSGTTPISDVKDNLKLLPADKFLGFVLNNHGFA